MRGITLDRRVQCVLLRRDGTGEVRFDPCPASLDPLTVAVVALAGPIAGLRAGDDRSADELADCSDVLEARAALDKCANAPRAIVTRACNLVERNWRAIERVACALRERGELGGWEVIGEMYARA